MAVYFLTYDLTERTQLTFVPFRKCLLQLNDAPYYINLRFRIIHISPTLPDAAKGTESIL